MKINSNVKTLLYGSNIWYLGEGMLGPLFAVFAERIGGDILEISRAWATFLIVTGVLKIIVGKAVDGKGQRLKAQVMVLGYALNAMFTFSYLLVSTSRHLFLVQIGLGIAAALASPTRDALYAKFQDKKHGAYERGLAGGEAQIITGLAIVLGGLIVTYNSFTVLFVIMGCLQVISTLYQMRILRKE